MSNSVRKLIAVVGSSFVLLFLSAASVHAETYYFHTDHLGTPQSVTDSTQQIAWQAEYDPFGEATETVTNVEQNLRFPGQYYDAESGLHYNYFRDYDPFLGRYVQSDPIGLYGGLNTYGYAYQIPISLTDPYGLDTLRCSRGLGGPGKNPMKPAGNVFRHDYIVVDGDVYSFQAGDNMVWSDGKVDDNEKASNSECQVISNDPKFDEAVREAVSEIGAPKYNVAAYPYTPTHMMGARNCQTWAVDVLNRANNIWVKK